MAGQDAEQDRNQFPALLGHSGTAGTAETVRAVFAPGGAQYTVRAVHLRIRNSKEWMAFHFWDDLADGGTAYLHVKTGTATSTHGNLIVETDNRINLGFYENPSLSSDGSSVTAYCMNRETDGTALTSIYHTAGVGTIGTKLECGVLGAAGKFSAAGGDITNGYWLLSPDESYILEIVNTSGTSVDICAKYQWHEHDAV